MTLIFFLKNSVVEVVTVDKEVLVANNVVAKQDNEELVAIMEVIEGNANGI